MNKIICVIQARMSSTRFPGKIMSPILGYPLLYRVVQRVIQSNIKDIVIATTTNTEDDIIPCMLKCYNLDIPIIRGNENDVLSRYILAADTYKADAVIRITADCPLVDFRFINEAVDIFQQNDVDYVSFDNTMYIEGVCDAEVIKTTILKKVFTETADYKHREHVTTYITDNLSKFKTIIKEPSVIPLQFIASPHLSVDTIQDLNYVRQIYQHFYPRIDFSHDEISKYLK